MGNVIVGVGQLLLFNFPVFPAATFILLFKSNYTFVAMCILLFPLEMQFLLSFEKSSLSYSRSVNFDIKNFLIELCYSLALLCAIPFASS